MTKDQKLAVRNLKLKFDGDSGDEKWAMYVGNDDNLRIDVDTDDCNRDQAKAAFARVVAITNLCAGLEIHQVRNMVIGN